MGSFSSLLPGKPALRVASLGGLPPPPTSNRASRLVVGASTVQLCPGGEERTPGAEPRPSTAHVEPWGWVERVGKRTGHWTAREKGTGSSNGPFCKFRGMDPMGWHPRGSPGPHPAQYPALSPPPPIPDSCCWPGSAQVHAAVPPGRVWATYPFSFSVKASGARGAADGAICWSLRPGLGLLVEAPLPMWVRSPTDGSLRSGRPLAGTVVWWTPLGGFVSEARWPAWPEARGGAETVAVREVAADFRLRAPCLSPALETPFLTRTAFSSAWVRSSSSLRS